MNLSPTSRTLFVVQIGTFLSGFLVIVCCCLYLSAYPKSPDAGSVSAIACATLAFALLSTITTLVLVIRQKTGRSISANIEGCWVGLALVLWILASVGGIAKPANDMRNVTCKVLPTGKETDDKNFKRACQSMFASTAFCILSAIFFIATAIILVTFAIQRAVNDKKAAQVKVGGTYQLGPSPSQYRRAEQAYEIPVEEPKDEEAGASPSAEPATSAAPDLSTSVLSPATTSTPAAATETHHFSNNIYQTPVITTAAPVATPAPAAIAHSTLTPSPYNTYAGSGHIPQASYQSTAGGYDNIGSYMGGHVHQGSAVSNMSANAYDQYNPSPYGNAGTMYPPQQQQQHPTQVQMPYPPTAYPMMGALHQNSPYGNQYVSQQQPGAGLQTPVMAMPRPEYF
ncbi:hypothetical protein BC939DRAFT_446433 [Gamsiella multidivaricata]|uniref:uncharacterized protein n=1 Tax=Gamsiella multidivaricata TaxID=101098 RepID=UPI002220722B|nr:uncharacterized protein BC939DRAFT_446433 [Gamsiella multidivaricata]KAG0351505.1 hypothetical protein BGZ54_003230 [Gamsiella multidivaricata]KAI7826986.1 hypothetical protein BC939DRAFT_446433 [Gamsiella multidivaricata]